MAHPTQRRAEALWNERFTSEVRRAIVLEDLSREDANQLLSTIVCRAKSSWNMEVVEADAYLTKVVVSLGVSGCRYEIEGKAGERGNLEISRISKLATHDPKEIEIWNGPDIEPETEKPNGWGNW